MIALSHPLANVRSLETARTQGRVLRALRILRPVLCLALCAASSLTFADDAIDKLVRLVGPEAGLCVEIPRLEETVTAFERGEFFQRLQRSRIYADWQAGDEYRHARGVVTVIENFTGKSFRQFFHDMFGRAVVVVVYAEPGREMSAIMLTETSSREALDAVIEGWNRAEPQQTDAIEFAGQTYYKRVCAQNGGPGKLVLFYCKLDRTLMLTDREEWIRRSLTLARASDPNESLWGLPGYQAARKSLQGGEAARAFVNPRAWDGVLGFTHTSTPAASVPAGNSASTPSAAGATTPTSPTTTAPAPTALVKALEKAWKRCEWLAVGLQLDRGIVVEAVAHYSLNGITERGRQWIRSMSGPADFLRLVPRDALFVVAGRQAFGNLFKQLAPQTEAGAFDSLRQVSRGLLLGLDPFEDVLPAFRENFGAYLVPRKDSKPDELPLDGLLAAELPPAEAIIPARAGGTTEHQPSFRDALDNGLNIGLNLGAGYFNMRATGKPAVVRTETTGLARTRWIDSLGPYQPAYSLTTRFLVFATSPQAVRRFLAREASSASGQKSGDGPPAMAALAKRYFPTENQVIYIDTAAIRRFLVEHGKQLVQHATRVRSISAGDANDVLAHFLDVASLFDSVFAAGRIGEGSARLVVGGVIQEAVANAASTSGAPSFAGARATTASPPAKSSHAE
ncbi:MAG TPA: hypothetical protein VFG04_25710 [Planctomycetaceae bacterium]|nr:hypothetical protein [Planctomycetaceae bacterium]